MGLRLFFLPNFPGATLIPDSRVGPVHLLPKMDKWDYLRSLKNCLSGGLPVSKIKSQAY